MAKTSRPRRPAARSGAAVARPASRPVGGRAARTARTVFGRRNYVLLIAAVALIVIGYTLMRVENAVDGVLSLYVAPLLLLAGYLGVVYAILWRPRRAPEAALPAEPAPPLAAE